MRGIGSQAPCRAPPGPPFLVYLLSEVVLARAGQRPEVAGLNVRERKLDLQAAGIGTGGLFSLQ